MRICADALYTTSLGEREGGSEEEIVKLCTFQICHGRRGQWSFTFIDMYSNLFGLKVWVLWINLDRMVQIVSFQTFRK